MPAVHLQENSKLISGHVAEKKGYLYWVLNLTDENGKRKPKWIPTHKKVKGNKTWANNMLPTIRKEWTEKLLQEATASQQSASPSGPSSAAISFVDFLYQWLEYKYKSATGRVMDSKPIELSTYSGYEQQLNNPIAPYFREHPVALCDLTKQDILCCRRARTACDFLPAVSWPPATVLSKKESMDKSADWICSLPCPS